MGSREPYYEMKLAEARDLVGAPGQSLVSVKLRPVRSVEDDAAYVYPDDYAALRETMTRGLHVEREGWVSGGKATVYRPIGGGEVLVFVEHETGPEIIVAAAAAVGAAATIASLAAELVRSVARNDLGGKRFYKADAISIELRTESGAQQVVRVPLPASGESLTIAMDKLVVSITRHGASPSAGDHRLAKGLPPEAITVLFLGANPSDTTRLALTREIQEIDNRLRTTEFRDRFRLVQQWEVQANEVAGKIMRFKPQVVHFSGHGSDAGELVFQDSQGQALAADPKTLGRIFGLIGDSVRCVLLNACFSKKQAQTIAKHVDTVVGMSRAIGDLDAIAFAGAFYEALGYDRDVATAFGLATAGISLSGLSDQDVPALIARKGIDPRTVRLAGAGAA